MVLIPKVWKREMSRLQVSMFESGSSGESLLMEDEPPGW